MFGLFSDTYLRLGDIKLAADVGSTGNGRNPMFNGRRQPSRGGTSRMTRECQVRFCERLGVKFPGNTRHPCRISNVQGWSGYPPILSVNADIPYGQPSAGCRHYAVYGRRHWPTPVPACLSLLEPSPEPGSCKDYNAKGKAVDHEWPTGKTFQHPHQPPDRKES
jgi:hypothetical protein